MFYTDELLLAEGYDSVQKGAEACVCRWQDCCCKGTWAKIFFVCFYAWAVIWKIDNLPVLLLKRCC